MSKQSDLSPPSHLSEASKALWRQLVPRRAKSPERLELLIAALEARDRCEQVREAIEADGLTCTTKSTGAVHVNPLLKVEKDARQQFLAAWAALSFAFDSATDGKLNLEG